MDKHEDEVVIETEGLHTLSAETQQDPPTTQQQQQQQQLYRYGFWDKEMAKTRSMLFSAIVLPLVYTALLLWLCLSLFYGSLITNNTISKVRVTAVNLDVGGSVGRGLISGIEAANAANPNHLDWDFGSPLGSDEDARSWVLDEQSWAVLLVSANASSALTRALHDGIASYNPLGAVTLYYASARNQITVSSKVLPSILATVNPLLSQAGVNNTAIFLASVDSNGGALQTALRCPQCLAAPLALNSVDLIPFDSATANGSVTVGLISLLTFAFSIFQILRGAALLMSAQLRLKSVLVFRTISSLIAYLFMALWYTLINLAFGVPMQRYFGSSGFVVFWLLNFCTMGAVGLPLESLFTFVGLKWGGYFLSFWIFVNVSGAFNSFDLMSDFFQYGYAFPFYHTIQAARTIIFGTKSHLGLNFGVLILWMIAGLLGMYTITAWRVKRNLRTGIHVVP